jgi:hypothetical protein
MINGRDGSQRYICDFSDRQRGTTEERKKYENK